MLRGKATLPLWFEPSHDYVSPAVTEIIYGPVGLIRAGFSAVGLFLGRKSKISIEETPKEFQFYIRMPNFRLLGSIIKKKYPKVADPFNPLVPIAHKSARIDKISILKLEGIIKKISYERRDYESVDEKSLSKAMSRKTMKKRIQALKG